MAGRRARKRIELANRRRKVAQLYLARMTQEEIAETLQVDQSTVSRDLSYMTRQWRRKALGDIHGLRVQEWAELEEMDRDCALRYLKDRESRWVEVRLKVKQRKARMLALDLPRRLHLDGDLGAQAKPSEGVGTEELYKLIDVFGKFQSMTPEELALLETYARQQRLVALPDGISEGDGGES